MRNAIIHGCNIFDGVSTFMMLTHIWKSISSPNLVPSSITFYSYDRGLSKPYILYRMSILSCEENSYSWISILVIDAQLNYNILFKCIYMQFMKENNSQVFFTMVFPHNGKIVNLDHYKYYESLLKSNPNNIVPTIGLEKCSSYVYIILGI